MTSCLLCSSSSDHFYRDKKREFFHCGHCDLIFVPKKDHLLPFQEKREYDFQENDPSDPDYRKFLNRILVPLERYLAPEMEGLDFGSGPGPTLHLMLQEKGYKVEVFDPFYANHPDRLEREYDFVTCTEVVEHFCNPKASWQVLSSLVKKEGRLAIMTLLCSPEIKKNFSSWWYKNNCTHVSFYSFETLQWIAEQFSLQLTHCDDRTALFVKK
jgi:hypothetical protein